MLDERAKAQWLAISASITIDASVVMIMPTPERLLLIEDESQWRVFVGSDVLDRTGCVPDLSTLQKRQDLMRCFPT